MPWREIQQRGAGGAEPQAVRDRMADVALMYETESPGLFLDTARKYGVEYVYLGPAERVYFPGPGLDKFAAMAGSSLERIFTNGGSVGLSRARRGRLERLLVSSAKTAH